MNITFLGTSHGVPSAERYCSCTMIEVGGATYFIDCGAPLIDLLIRRGTDLNSIRAIFTTHMHGDHVNGLTAFADLCNWYYKTTSFDVYLTDERGLTLFPDMIEAVECSKLDTERIRFKLMTSDFIYEDENIRVTPIPTKHLAHVGRPSYAYLVEAEGKRVIFTGDMSQKLGLADFPAYPLENSVNLVISEMAHFDVCDVEPYLERCKAKQVLFNHVYTLDKLDRINALDGKFGYRIHTVDDGDKVVL